LLPLESWGAETPQKKLLPLVTEFEVKLTCHPDLYRHRDLYRHPDESRDDGKVQDDHKNLLDPANSFHFVQDEEEEE
jgi:hypothetical protein